VICRDKLRNLTKCHAEITEFFCEKLQSKLIVNYEHSVQNAA